jgi:hypothetical protein
MESEQELAERRMDRGLEILSPVVSPHGFKAVEKGGGKGSGGFFANAVFARDEDRIELSVRRQSVQVHYAMADRGMLSHTDFIRAVAGPAAGNRFPSFADDTDRAFEALAFDIEHFLGGFLSGDSAAFERCLARVAEESELSGTARLARIERGLHRDGRSPG